MIRHQSVHVGFQEILTLFFFVSLGFGIRLDSHVRAGDVVSPYYDSMIAKLIVTADSRPEAVERLKIALANFEVEGLTTNIPLLRYIAAQPDFAANKFHTRWLEQDVLPSFQQDHA